MKSRLHLIFAPIIIFLFAISAAGIALPANTASASSSSALTTALPPAFPASSNAGGYNCNATSYCPMGIADYGVGPHGTYGYTTNIVTSKVNFTSLNIGKADISGGNHEMTVQQNLVDYGVAVGNNVGEYWTQDVPYVITTKTGFDIYMLDNIWNMSAAYPATGACAPYNCMQGSDIVGNLEHNCAQSGGSPLYYYCEGKIVTKVTLPFQLVTTQTTGVMTSGTYKGDTYVKFAISIYQSGVLVTSKTYDEVVFLGTTTSSPDFKVGGNNPWGTYNDIETVLCGPGGGSYVNMTAISASLQEYYGHSMKQIPHAWSAGSDTAETINDVHVTASSHVALANIGVDNNQELW
jgi:hypothetical protein